MEKHDQTINEAEGLAIGKVKTAEALSVKVVAQARASATEKTKEAAGDLARFGALVSSRKGSEGLTDFRIYWDVLTNALRGRDLVLIDADNVKGQRNLFLFDPDQWRPPLIQRFP